MPKNSPAPTNTNTAKAPTQPAAKATTAIDASVLKKPSNPTTPAQPAAQPAPAPVQKGTMTNKKPIAVIIIIIALVAGVGTGYGIHTLNAGGGGVAMKKATPIKTGSPTGDLQVGDVYGSPNEDIFKDSAEGVLQEGGIEGEGSHSLLRPGGDSQTVYMTSSTVDLDKFVGTKVKVWGETFAAQQAGWLMDVGRVQVIELDAEPPTEE